MPIAARKRPIAPSAAVSVVLRRSVAVNRANRASIVTASGKVRRVIVVGGGLAGLTTVIKLCEAGIPVDLFSLVPVKRSHSVCAQGGINASVNTKGEGDSPEVHLEETVYGGDFLANQPPAKAMCEMAPSIIYLFDRMGVPFSRTQEGLLDFRRFGGIARYSPDDRVQNASAVHRKTRNQIKDGEGNIYIAEPDEHCQQRRSRFRRRNPTGEPADSKT